MALDKQVNIYSVDTSAFYDSYERKIHMKTIKLKAEYGRLVRLLEKLNKYEKRILSTNIENINIDKLERYHMSFKRFRNKLIREIDTYKKYMTKEVAHEKEKLLNHFQVRRDVYGKYNNRRKMNRNSLKDKDVISIFQSSLTRMLGMDYADVKYDDLIVVRVYYFDILKDLIDNGFTLNGQKYIYLTSSAGQIRTKKTVFIKEKLFNKYEKTIMCGLTLEDINNKGGINVNKYLAYMALISSATDVWNGFDIDKSIVVDDFESSYTDWVDYINYENYQISREKKDITIPHMDGCGIMLDKTNTMIRLPFIKGLMAYIPFDKFIKEKKREGFKKCGIIKDIYGVEHDILKEEIRYIFTKSQFKLYKYYDSWEQYKESFKKFNCQACKCNEEESEISNAKINYQMLQTLSDMTDDEVLALSKATRDEIENISSDRKTMLSVLGVNDNLNRQSNLQMALRIYPELLQDVHCREVLKQTKASLVKDAKSGKIKINGKYTFVIPDLYAFMEWLFLDEENPKGLLKNGEIYCSMFENEKELDCLRAPHLAFEHSIRVNTINEENKKWFKSNAIYTSTQDLISKVLQFDCDGDKLLVVDDPLLVDIAKRNIEKYDVAPLYYEMKKAPSQIVDKNSVYNGLITAYTGGNIGVISNNISKMWNSFGDNVEENKEILKAIKLMCMENNFVIDYAKTLYKPTRPKDIDDLMKKYTVLKLPHFFRYAKDKEDEQVAKANDSTVNKFDRLIVNLKMKFKATNLGKCDYHMLMHNKDIENDETVINKYMDLNRSKKKIAKEEWDKKRRGYYTNQYIKKELLIVNDDINYVCDVLIKHLYEHNSINKNTLWDSFGDIIVDNLKNNIDTNTKLCEVCGERFIIENKNDYCSVYCNRCKSEKDRENARLRKQKQRNRDKK